MADLHLSLGGRKEAFSGRCSQVHNQIISELRQKNLKGQARKIVLESRGVSALRRAVEEKVSYIDSSDEESSEDEEDIAERERKLTTARQHWGVIKRYVNDRIKQRRRNKGGWNREKAMNNLRAQTRISMKPDQVRRELFEKYGIIPKPGKAYPVDVMKPVFPAKAREIIAKFEQIQINSVRPRTIHGKRVMEVQELPKRPKTTHIYTKPLVL